MRTLSLLFLMGASALALACGDGGGTAGSGGGGDSGATSNNGATSGGGGSMIECGLFDADCDFDPANGCEVNLQSDIDNCGKCGLSCGDGACNAGKCDAEMVASLGGSVGEALVVAGEHAYITTWGEGLVRVPLPDGPAASFIPSNDTLFDLVLAGSDLIASRTGNTTFLRFPLDGGQAAEITGLYASHLSHSAVSGDALYWCEPSLMAIQRSSLNNPMMVALAGGQIDCGDLALDATHAYWLINGPAGAVRRVALAGGNVEDVASGVANPVALALTDEDVFWVSADGLWHAPKSGGPPENIVTLSSGEGSAIATDGSSVYWGTNIGRIHRYDTATAAGGEIAKCSGEVADIDFYGDDVYWMTTASAGLWRTPK